MLSALCQRAPLDIEGRIPLCSLHNCPKFGGPARSSLSHSCRVGRHLLEERSSSCTARSSRFEGLHSCQAVSRSGAAAVTGCILCGLVLAPSTQASDRVLVDRAWLEQLLMQEMHSRFDRLSDADLLRLLGEVVPQTSPPVVDSLPTAPPLAQAGLKQDTPPAASGNLLQQASKHTTSSVKGLLSRVSSQIPFWPAGTSEKQFTDAERLAAMLKNATAQRTGDNNTATQQSPTRLSSQTVPEVAAERPQQPLSAPPAGSAGVGTSSQAPETKNSASQASNTGRRAVPEGAKDDPASVRRKDAQQGKPPDPDPDATTSALAAAGIDLPVAPPKQSMDPPEPRMTKGAAALEQARSLASSARQQLAQRVPGRVAISPDLIGTAVALAGILGGILIWQWDDGDNRSSIPASNESSPRAWLSLLISKVTIPRLAWSSAFFSPGNRTEALPPEGTTPNADGAQQPQAHQDAPAPPSQAHSPGSSNGAAPASAAQTTAPQEGSVLWRRASPTPDAAQFNDDSGPVLWRRSMPTAAGGSTWADQGPTAQQSGSSLDSSSEASASSQAVDDSSPQASTGHLPRRQLVDYWLDGPQQGMSVPSSPDVSIPGRGAAVPESPFQQQAEMRVNGRPDNGNGARWADAVSGNTRRKVKHVGQYTMDKNRQASLRSPGPGHNQDRGMIQPAHRPARRRAKQTEGQQHMLWDNCDQ